MRVLLSSNMYPNRVNPSLGIFVAEQLEALEKHHGVEVIRLVSGHSTGTIRGKYRKYAELYGRGVFVLGEPFDLIHMHYPSLPQWPAVLTPWLLRRRPLVV